MKDFIERYIRNCHVCRRFKAFQDRYFELLNSFFISNKFWIDIIMNFVTELLMSNEFNVILMIVDRLIKMRHYIFCTAKKEDIFAEETTHLLIKHVWKLHDLSDIIVFDRESQFISLVWKSFCKTLKIIFKLSTHFISREMIKVK
jgi:hypothetical protein